MNGTITFRNPNEPRIRVRWEKVAYDANIDYNQPSASSPKAAE